MQAVSIQALSVHGIGVGAGYLGAALGVGMVVPQIVRILRDRSLPGVSALSWSLTAAACAAWLLYGVRTGELPQIPGNVLLVSGSLLIALLVPSAVRTFSRAVRLAAVLAAIGAVALLAPAPALGLLGFGIGLTSSLPQLLVSVRRPAGEPSSLSVTAWLLRCASQASWLCFALVVHDRTVAVSATVLLLSAALVLAVELRRRPVPLPAIVQEEALAVSTATSPF